MNNPVFTDRFKLSYKGAWQDPHLGSNYAVYSVEREGSTVAYPLRVELPGKRGLRRVDVLAALRAAPWYAAALEQAERAEEEADTEALAGSKPVLPVQPAGCARVAAHG